MISLEHYLLKFIGYVVPWMIINIIIHEYSRKVQIIMIQLFGGFNYWLNDIVNFGVWVKYLLNTEKGEINIWEEVSGSFI